MPLQPNYQNSFPLCVFDLVEIWTALLPVMAHLQRKMSCKYNIAG